MGKLNINNGGVDTNKVMPSIDERYGPYASLAAVEAEFGSEGRDAKCAGLTVGVTQFDGSVKEYCYQPSASDSSVFELVEKQSAEITVDDTIKEDSPNAVSGGAVYDGLATKQDTINDLSTIRRGASDGADVKQSYLKPGESSGSSSVTDFDNFNDTVHNVAQVLSPAQQQQSRQNINAQEALVSGTTIKTVNGTSLLGSGNISIPAGESIKYINLEDVEDLPEADASYSNIIALIPSSETDGVVDQYACIEDAVVDGAVVSDWSWVYVGTTSPIVNIQKVDTYQPLLPIKKVSGVVLKSGEEMGESTALDTYFYDIDDADTLVCDFAVVSNGGPLVLSFFDDGFDVNDLSSMSSHYLGWRIDKNTPPYVVTENTEFSNQIIHVDDDTTLGSGDVTGAKYVGLTIRVYSPYGSVSTMSQMPQSLVKKQPIALEEILIFNTYIQLPQIWDSSTASSTAITTTPQLSTWGIVFPSEYSNVGKPTPIIAMLHGLDGYVAEGIMGYDTHTWEETRNAYVDAGFAVMDVNGYGVGDLNDQDSKPWGNPASVETLDKAFEYLKQNYNVCDKLLIAGISMGAVLGMSYAKCFPGKVAALGCFAPNLLAYSARYVPSDSKAVAWGYTNSAQGQSDAWKHLTGYVVLANPKVIDSNGFLKKYDWPAEKPSDWPANLDDLQLVESFPVPMRVWQGTADTSVDPNCSKLLVNSLRRGNSNATLRLCSGAGHAVQNEQYVRNEAVSWFNRFVV